MKKVMVFVAVLTMVAFAFGAMAAEKAKTAPAPKMQKIRGIIVMIDARAKTFDVKTVKGKEEGKVMTFATDQLKKIEVVKTQKKRTFADLKEGMDVSVEYKAEAKNQAIVVWIHHAPKTAPAPK
jgi:hypothetical protein